ncbi:hypothetical protein OEZ86_008450 [Tetradesmus obliquus]|nr:hypothetical protein OEZ86_008450 [Tetradesmus obliquus]
MSRDWDDCLRQQLMALSAAAVGIDPLLDGFLAPDAPGGRLLTLAAAHPEAYAALVDCYLRSPLTESLYHSGFN